LDLFIKDNYILAKNQGAVYLSTMQFGGVAIRDIALNQSNMLL